MLRLVHRSSPRKRGPSLCQGRRPLGPRLGGDERATQSAIIFGCMIAALSASPTLAADKVRVGKAVAEAFSFVPPDIGMRTGIFQKHNTELELNAFDGHARIQQAPAAHSIDMLLGSCPP